MKKRVALFALVAGLLISPSRFVFAYNDKTTHPALTQETADYFNRIQGGLTQQQIEWMIAGATAEDTFPRWINHFYDPVHNAGWTGAGAGNVSPETIQAARTVGVSYESPVSTIEWINSYMLQQSYGMYGGNRTWEKGLEYAADGNEEQEFMTLGHTLHLLQDMAVPDHTRDDTHAGAIGEITGDPGSPYENYAAGFNRDNIKKLNIPDILQKGDGAPTFTSADDYLKNMAVYSNRYFFSRDTINIDKYLEPKIAGNINQFAVGKDDCDKEFLLASGGRDVLSTAAYLSEKSSPVFQDYFIRLGPKAVWYGAGLIRLYLKQVEDKKINKEFEVTDRDALKKVARNIVLPNISVGALIDSTFSFIGNTFWRMGAAVGGVANLALETVGMGGGGSYSSTSSTNSPAPATVDADGAAKALIALFETPAVQAATTPAKETDTTDNSDSTLIINDTQVFVLNPTSSAPSSTPPRTLRDLRLPTPSSLPPSSSGGGGGAIVVDNSFNETPVVGTPVPSAPSSTATTTPTESSPALPTWSASGTFDKASFTTTLFWPEKDSAAFYDVQEDGGAYGATVLCTSTQISTRDVGRSVRYTVAAKDADNNILATSSVLINIAPLWEKAYFYKHPTDGPVLELSYTTYPFIPSARGAETYQAILGYLNAEPVTGSMSIEDTNGFSVGEASGTIVLGDGMPYIFGTASSNCRGWGSGLQTRPCLPTEDMRARLKVVMPDNRDPQEGDYITLAYYDLPSNIGASYVFIRAARDFARIQFSSTTPADFRAPDLPSAKNLSFDTKTGVLSFDALPQTDVDSPDGELSVSWAFTAGEPQETDWHPVHSGNSQVSMAVTSSQMFKLSIKVSDSNGLISVSSNDWRAPEGYAFLPRQEDWGSASFPADGLGQYVKLSGGVDISAAAFRIQKNDGRYYKYGYSYLQIYEDNNGEHGLSLATSTATVSWYAYEDMQYNFASPVHLKSGAGYWFAVETPPEGGDPWYAVPVTVLGTDNADAYPEGGFNTMSGPDARFWLIRAE